jgi:hypothetical protein
MTILTHLVSSLRSASKHNPDVQAPPVCILWPDHERQWEAVFSVLKQHCPELYRLGDYAPEENTGPAIWLRCVLGGTISQHLPSPTTPPIFYLPGISRQDLRAIESCSPALKPLAELQYRGVIWAQANAKDWTLLAYLKSDQGGLSLDVSQDSDTKHAMQLSLYKWLEEGVALLKGKRLDKDYFNTLLSGGDPIRDVLIWINQGEAFQTSRSENEWLAFSEVCKSQLAFSPKDDGVLAAAAKLANHQGPWESVWKRYCEAPLRYPQLPTQIRKCQAPNNNIYWQMGGATFDGWPQWNDEQEKSLDLDLRSISQMPPHEARKKIIALEKDHGIRRSFVWAELGQSPLVKALEHLAVMAKLTQSSYTAGSVDELSQRYSLQGWMVDDAAMKALALVEPLDGFEAVSQTIRCIYAPWAEDSARYLQNIWSESRTQPPVQDETEEVIFFVDGLRYDCGKRLATMLADMGFSVHEKGGWAALPSVTATGKPAVAPLKAKSQELAEESSGFNFEYMSTYQLRKAIEANGYMIMDKNSARALPKLQGKKLWMEFGDIDHEGHDRGWKLAKHLDALLQEIKDCIAQLFNAGCKKMKVVTDHGWLLLPGGLPKTELSSALSDNKWGRCAALKDGAQTQERLFPWYWDPQYSFALADGISCFKKGEEYTHGGLSLQECFTLELTVSKGTATPADTVLDITDVGWKGLRCHVAIEGESSGCKLDIRKQAGNPDSSVVVAPKPFKANGTSSVVVIDESLEGSEAVIVLITSAGSLAGQCDTIGGDKK